KESILCTQVVGLVRWQRRLSPTSFCFLHRPPPSRGFLPRRHYSPPKESEEPEIEEPLCFTKSPANPRRWTTRQSMGSDHQQPLWRAMLISLTMLAILLWCYLRPETEADRLGLTGKTEVQHTPGAHQVRESWLLTT
uniref:Uncharacterized protein n=1 Tax=Naja naja TaxID=35670 RepID=A0A8C6YK96_NAJNA